LCCGDNVTAPDGYHVIGSNCHVRSTAKFKVYSYLKKYDSIRPELMNRWNSVRLITYFCLKNINYYH
jgi:hypothetical protein